MKIKIKKISIFLFLASYSLLLTAPIAQAAYRIKVALPYMPPHLVSPGLGEYMRYIYISSLGLVGLAALGALVYGGFMYMLSETITSKEEARSWIKGAISGLLLALAAYLILNTINPELVNWQLVLPDLPK